MSLHRYTPRVLAADYLRAGMGLVVTAGPLVLVEMQPAADVVFAILAGLFGLFGLRVGLRHYSAIESGEQALAVRGIRSAVVAWREIECVRMDYFSTRRDGRDGWMQMTVSGPGAKIRVESAIEGFEELVAAVTSRMPAGVALTETTLENLRALGIAVRGTGG